MNISVKRHILYIFLGFIFISFTSSFVIIEIKSEVPNPENPENKPEFFHNKSITDGPYIFYENEEIIVRWIKWNRLVERIISGKNSKLLKRNFGFEIDPYYLKNGFPDSVNYNQTYNGVDKFAAISDIHGQYDLFVQLLKNHKIIDSHLNWIYGKGHLVILGDIMDRGDKVTELLWLTYKLEKQAEKEGGKVHYMVGNHELMVLNNDIRYIHEKYTSTAHKMNIVYSQLFAKNTFFGQWLRTKRRRMSRK